MAVNQVLTVLMMLQLLLLRIHMETINTAGLNSNVQLASKPNTILTIFMLNIIVHARWILFIFRAISYHIDGAVLLVQHTGKISENY